MSCFTHISPVLCTLLYSKSKKISVTGFRCIFQRKSHTTGEIFSIILHPRSQIFTQIIGLSQSLWCPYSFLLILSKAFTFGENCNGHAACVSCLCAASVRNISRSDTLLKRYASVVTRNAGQPSCAVFVIVVRLAIIKFGECRYIDLAAV
jgi:hypothetical protein